MGTFVVGISGGSGAPYSRRLVAALLDAGHEVQLITTSAGMRVLRYEAGFEGGLEELGAWLAPDGAVDRLTIYGLQSVEATPASGSAPIDGVVICPCSMGTLARVAHGFSSNLLERSADVALKQQRKLVVVPRETPLSVVHLRNMLALAEAGAVVLPAMPGFYNSPESVGDLVDFVVARVLDALGVDNDLTARWQTPKGSDATSPWDEGEV